MNDSRLVLGSIHTRKIPEDAETAGHSRVLIIALLSPIFTATTTTTDTNFVLKMFSSNAPKFLVPIFAGKKIQQEKTSRFAHLKIYFLVIIKNNYRSSFFSLVASGSADALIT